MSDTDTSVVGTAGVPADARDDAVRTGLAAIPAEVVIRHTCHCKAAVEPPAPGEPEEHVFTVDGHDFPYLLPAENPEVSRVADNLYKIGVKIILFDKDTRQVLPFTYRPTGYGVPCVPVINGRDFPFTCDDSGFQLNFSHKTLPTLQLVFFAHHVTGNIAIQDRRRGKAVYDTGGDRIAAGKEECFECGDLVDDQRELFAHIDARHPEHVRHSEHGKRYRVS
jgi:hypothetical protein